MVSPNNRRTRIAQCRCLDGHVKAHSKCLWRWGPDRMSNFFFSPNAYIWAVTYITERSLHVTSGNQSHSLTNRIVKDGGNFLWFCVRTCGVSPRSPPNSYPRRIWNTDPFIYIPYRKLYPFIYNSWNFTHSYTFRVKKIPHWYTFDVKRIPIHILGGMKSIPLPAARLYIPLWRKLTPSPRESRYCNKNQNTNR